MYCLSSVSGGAVSYLRNLVLLLSELFEKSSEKHSLYFLAHESQKELFPPLPDKQCKWIVGSRLVGWQRIVWERRNLARIIREMNVDVLFTPYQISSHVGGVKQVLMLRNMEPFLFKAYPYSMRSRLRNQVLQWQSSSALRSADRVIAVSGFADECLKNRLRIPSQKVRKIYHGRDTAFSHEGDRSDDLNQLFSIGVEGDFLLTCGSLLPYRRCEDVIESFNRCAGSIDSKIQLVIAGSGSDSRYAKTIHLAIVNSPYKDRILVVGHVSKETMISLYRRCLVCIIATEIEACPNIAIEAMSSGCTVISSDRSPLPEIFAGSSLVFSSRDVEGLSQQIRVCLSDENLRIEMSKRALQRSLAFSWQKCAEETFAALTEWPQR